MATRPAGRREPALVAHPLAGRPMRHLPSGHGPGRHRRVGAGPVGAGTVGAGTVRPGPGGDAALQDRSLRCLRPLRPLLGPALPAWVAAPRSTDLTLQWLVIAILRTRYAPGPSLSARTGCARWATAIVPRTGAVPGLTSRRRPWGVPGSVALVTWLPG